MNAQTSPREIAATILAEKSLGRAVPTDLRALLADEVVNVEFYSSPGGHEGRLEMVEGNAAIFINTFNHDPEYPRVRFTFAHEIGHFFLHRHLLRGGRVISDQRIELTGDGTVNPIEREANEFASELLLPARWLDSQLDRTKVLDLNTILGIADAAKASVQATAIRMMQRTTDCAAVMLLVDGTVEWVAASEDWREKYLPSRALVGQPVPPRAASAKRADSFREERVDVSAWSPKQKWRSLDLYESALSTPYGRLVFLGADVTDD